MRTEFRNSAEKAFFDFIANDGWVATKRGWPDFACFRNDDLILVEVKPTANQHLKLDQYRLMESLSTRGIDCFRWNPETGFEQVTSEKLDLSTRSIKKLKEARRVEVEVEQTKRRIKK